MTTFEGWYQQV